MSDTFRLGRVAGIQVGVNWTVLVIFLLLTFGLGSGRLPEIYPDRDPWLYVVAALTAGLVFLGSLLAHEVAHALVARRHGMAVEGITLWLLGGVARIRGEASDPRAELRIAGVGPLVSLLLALGFGAVDVVLVALGVSGLPIGVLGWLAGINLMLAVFNSIPAAPLDGGRMLRAYLWRRHGDRLRAAVSAARIGRVFGYALAGMGLLSFLAGGGVGGLWLGLIGIFLASAASAEERQAATQGQLAGIVVRAVMSPNPTVVPEEESVAEFLDRFVFAHRFSTFPTVDRGGRTTGLVTLNRVKRVSSERRVTVRVRDIACPLVDVATADPDEPLADVLPRMAGCTDGRALVVSGGQLVGILSPSDVTRALEYSRLRG